MGPRRILSWAWLAAFLAAALWLALRLPGASLETSVFELVPWRAPNPAARAGAEALRRQVEGRILVLAGAGEEAAAQRGAEAYARVLRGIPGAEAVVCALPPDLAGRAVDFFGAHRSGLLSAEDRRNLEQGGTPGRDALLASAQEALFVPGGLNGPLGFSGDPFGVFNRWLGERGAAAGALEPRQGHLEVEGEGKVWVAVSARLRPGLDPQAAGLLDAGLERAAAAAKAQGAEELLRTGFAFHEHAAAAQARREVGAVGALSTALLALLLWVAFRRPAPMLLALLPAAVGCVAGAAAVLLLWDRVHLVALVFGSTVVGVADDYGLYFLSGLYDGPWRPWDRERAARTPLALAMATSVLAYAALLFLPIPGLRQVAVFAGVGLAADWAGVLLWYPRLAAGLSPVPETRKAGALALKRSWPRWGGRGLTLALIGVTGASAWGCLRLKADDDVRLLYAHDGRLESEQKKAQSLTGVGGASGFFVVQAKDAQELLRREEGLRESLAKAGAPRWQALSAWVPSLERQARDRQAMDQALAGPSGLAKRLAASLGRGSLPAPLERSLRQGRDALSLDAWLADPLSTPYRFQCLRQPDGSLVSLVLPGPGLDQADLDRLAPLAAQVPGAQYVDQLGAVSGLLGSLRRLLAWMLALGAALVFGMLAWRLGRRAWAAAAPTALGALVGLGALGWSCQPFNLFALLALLLLLGTAIDFGIYLQDGGARLSSFVAVQVAALVNIAAVGVLAFSGTPALRSFGLVLGLGCVAAWLCAPCFSPASGEPAHA